VVVYVLAFLVFQLVDGHEVRETVVMGMARCIYRLLEGVNPILRSSLFLCESPSMSESTMSCTINVLVTEDGPLFTKV
jgi:hypothetical protein